MSERVSQRSIWTIFCPCLYDTNAGDYTLTITINGQNDANTGGDAGNSIASATPILPGSYSGYMSSTDVRTAYSFQASSGQGIIITLEVIEQSDYDITLYNPNGVLVHTAKYYGDDTLEYPADMPGTWKIKFDMFRVGITTNGRRILRLWIRKRIPSKLLWVEL